MNYDDVLDAYDNGDGCSAGVSNMKINRIYKNLLLETAGKRISCKAKGKITLSSYSKTDIHHSQEVAFTFVKGKDTTHTAYLVTFYWLVHREFMEMSHDKYGTYKPWIMTIVWKKVMKTTT